MSIIPKSGNKIYSLIIFTLLLINSAAIMAMPLYTIDTSEFVYMGSSATRSFSYDSVAQNLNSEVDLTFIIGQSGSFEAPAGLEGNMQIDANIDNSGNLVSGDVTFVGGGASGIALGTTLMTGNIIDFSYVMTPADEITDFPNPGLIPAFEFIVEVTNSLAVLAFSDLLDFRYRYVPSPSVFDPFMNDFTASAYTGETIYTASKINAVPEPSIILLFLGGLIVMLGLKSRGFYS